MDKAYAHGYRTVDVAKWAPQPLNTNHCLLQHEVAGPGNAL